MFEMNFLIELLVAIDSSSVQLNTIVAERLCPSCRQARCSVDNEIRKNLVSDKRMFAAPLQRLEVGESERARYKGNTSIACLRDTLVMHVSPFILCGGDIKRRICSMSWGPGGIAKLRNACKWECGGVVSHRLCYRSPVL
jgi:hypothetical protein